MTELVVLRHARAGAGQNDFRRSLARKGWRQAEAAAEALVAAHFHVGRALCSPALRARETLVPLRSALHIHEADVILDERLYNATAGTIETIVNEHLAGAPLLLVGHNPGVEQFASWLAGSLLPLGTGNWVRLQLADELVEGGAAVTGRFRGEPDSPASRAAPAN